MITVGIITASDKGAAGKRVDISGGTIREICEKNNMKIIAYEIVEDDKEKLANTMITMSDKLNVNLILTTGGTGFSKRDVTPEATLSVIDRQAYGIPEAIRAYSMTITKRAMLSRAVAGIRNETLIVNLPGSPKAVTESLEYIIDSISHGINILLGEDSECGRK